MFPTELRGITRLIVASALLILGLSYHNPGQAFAADAKLSPDDPSNMCSGPGRLLNNVYSPITFSRTVGPQVQLGSATGPYQNEADRPSIKTGKVEGSGTLYIKGNPNCSAYVSFYLESNVCGMWGCNPRALAKDDVIDLPQRHGQIDRSLEAKCRKGTHDYRVRVETVWTVLNDDKMLETKVDSKPDGDDGWIKLSC